MIKAAAIMTDTKTYTGRTHNDCLYQIMNEESNGNIHAHGFVTDAGVFMNRDKAYKHAAECKQVPQDLIDRSYSSLYTWMIDI